MPQRGLEQIYLDLVTVSEKLENSNLNKLVEEIRTYILTEDEKTATKEWKRSSGKITFEKGHLTVDVYRNANYPGVMIHRHYKPNGELQSGWVISHELSGLKLGSIVYNNMRKAVKAFLEHAANVNWDRPKEEILADPEAKTAYYNMKLLK
ncbi:MAG: hypothetical protein ACOY9Y_02285 [Bacillota bacterium]